VYTSFSQAKKCWAHLPDTVIKLMLLEPEKQERRQFTNRLLQIYRRPYRMHRDGRLGVAGRTGKVSCDMPGVYAYVNDGFAITLA
jgi:hypothetical protein